MILVLPLLRLVGGGGAVGVVAVGVVGISVDLCSGVPGSGPVSSFSTSSNVCITTAGIYYKQTAITSVCTNDYWLNLSLNAKELTYNVTRKCTFPAAIGITLLRVRVYKSLISRKVEKIKDTQPRSIRETCDRGNNTIPTQKCACNRS